MKKINKDGVASTKNSSKKASAEQAELTPVTPIVEAPAPAPAPEVPSELDRIDAEIEAEQERGAAENIAQLEEEEAVEGAEDLRVGEPMSDDQIAADNAADRAKDVETSATPAADPGVLPDAEKRAEEKASAEGAEQKTPEAGDQKTNASKDEKGAQAEAEKEHSRNYLYQKRIKSMSSPDRFVEYAELPQTRCDVMLEESSSWESKDAELQGRITQARQMVIWAKELLAEAAILATGLPKEIVVKGKKTTASSGAKASPADNWKAGDVLRVRKTDTIRAQYTSYLTPEEMEALTFVELRGPTAVCKTATGKEQYLPKNHLAHADAKETK